MWNVPRIAWGMGYDQIYKYFTESQHLKMFIGMSYNLHHISPWKFVYTCVKSNPLHLVAQHEYACTVTRIFGYTEY